MSERQSMAVIRQGQTALWALLVLLLAAGCNLGLGRPAEETLPQITGAPVVQIIAPLPNATYLTNVDVNILARVTNAGADVASVEVSVNEEVIAALQNPNPSGAESFSVTQTWFSTMGANTISVRVLRADGSASEPASVTINVTDDVATAAPTASPTAQASPTPQQTATNTVAATQATRATTPATAAATQPPASTAPKVRALGFTNVRRGPSTNFEPPLGAINTGEEYDILASNLAGDWLKISYRGGEAWVFRTIVEVVGELTNVPREAGPPIPTRPPATNTPPAPAATNTVAAPATGANLTIPAGGFALYPTAGGGKDNIFQNEDVYVEVRVQNNGSANSGPFVVALEIYYKDNNAPAVTTVTATVADLAPGADTVVPMGYRHTEGAGRFVYVLAKVDPNNAVGETNEGDNQTPNIEYVIGAR